MPHKNKKEHNAYHRTYQKKRYHRRRDGVISKLGGKCVQCGSIENLELDHIEPKTKKFSIAKLWGTSEKIFWEEITKCQLLCKPCHIEKSIDDRGMKNARKTHGTISSYRYCRCNLCKKAKSKYNKKYKENRNEKEKTRKENTKTISFCH